MDMYCANARIGVGLGLDLHLWRQENEAALFAGLD